MSTWAAEGRAALSDQGPCRSSQATSMGPPEAGDRAGRKGMPPAAPYRPHHDQGIGPGVSLAPDAGDPPLRHDRRTRPGRKDQRVLCQSDVAADAAGAGDRGGDPGRAAAPGDDAAGVDGAVPIGVGPTTAGKMTDLHALFQLLGGPECDLLAGLDLNRLARRRIPSHPRR